MGCGASNAIKVVREIQLENTNNNTAKGFISLEKMEQSSAEMFTAPNSGASNMEQTENSDESSPERAGKVEENEPENEMRAEIEERVETLRCAPNLTDEACTEHYNFLKKFYRKYIQKKRNKKEWYDILVDANFVVVYKRFLSEVFSERIIEAEGKPLFANFRVLQVMLWNGTDASITLCEEVVDEDLYIEIFKSLDSPWLLPSREQDQESTKAIIIAKAFCGTLHNVVQNFDVVEDYRACNAVEILNKYRKSVNYMLRCKVEFILAYILNEEENSLLNAHAENIKFMGKILESSLKVSTHHSKLYGYNAFEVIGALNRLAANDENKFKIVNEGLLKHYVKLLDPETSTPKEQVLAARGIWVLAFKVRDKIKEEDSCIAALKVLAESENIDVEKAALGALWILEGKNDAENAMTHAADSSKATGHIMISYQWDTKPIILRVRDYLVAAGYKVWIDVDRMSGDILESMAKAIEEASVVIVCLSHKYKESPNCRTEAEYAYRCHKTIVPLLLEPKYRPDGWLGALAGNRLYFDISLEEKRQKSFMNLAQEIARLTSVKSKSIVMPTLIALTQALVPPVTATAYWDEYKVASWFRENGVGDNKKKLVGMDGDCLLELREMHQNAPEAFYTTLREDLGMSLISMLKLTKALKRLQ